MNDVAELRRTVEDLCERVATLEFGLYGRIEPLVQLGLTMREALILGLLMKNEFASNEAIELALWGLHDAPESAKNCMSVSITRIRKKLSIPIECRYGAGWFLTADAKRRVHMLVSDGKAVA